MSHIAIYGGSIICYNHSGFLNKVGAHNNNIIELVSNAMVTDNVNPIAFKMTTKLICIIFLVIIRIQFFPCAFDVPFCNG